MLLGGDDLKVSRNHASSAGDGFGIEILVGSDDASIRIADNTILAESGSGLDYRNDAGQLICVGNRVEVEQAALVVHRISVSQNRIGKAQIEGNVFTSTGEVRTSVVVCGPVEKPDTTQLEHMIFTSNQVRSSRLTTDVHPTVYLNSRALICTNNFVQEPDNVQSTSIRTPLDPNQPPRGIMAHNLTTSGVSSVNGFTGNNVIF